MGGMPIQHGPCCRPATICMASHGIAPNSGPCKNFCQLALPHKIRVWVVPFHVYKRKQVDPLAKNSNNNKVINATYPYLAKQPNQTVRLILWSQKITVI